MTTPAPSPGRPRDPELDVAILAAARDHLAAHGYEAMSVIAVAEAAGTTRQALYRRFPSKADLANAAIASMSRADERPDTDDPYADLVTELRAFHQGVTRPNGLGLVGAMLQEATDPVWALIHVLFPKDLLQLTSTKSLRSTSVTDIVTNSTTNTCAILSKKV